MDNVQDQWLGYLYDGLCRNKPRISHRLLSLQSILCLARFLGSGMLWYGGALDEEVKSRVEATRDYNEEGRCLMGSGIMVRSDGRQWKEHRNKGLSRPRYERCGGHSAGYVKTTVTSIGMPGGGGGSETRMMFGSGDPRWGRQTKEPKRETTKDGGNK